MITFTNLTKKYGEVTVINNATFTISKNKLTCLVGANGTGKSTLLNIIAGLLDYEGVIENLPSKTAYVFQEHSLILNKTVVENLKFFNNVNCNNKINNALLNVNLLHKKDSYVSALSGGEKQRLQIARAMLTDADCILLDEPFNSLDVASRKTAITTFYNFVKQNNKTAILITHDIAEAASYADEVLVFSNGQIEKVVLDGDQLTNFKKMLEIQDNLQKSV